MSDHCDTRLRGYIGKTTYIVCRHKRSWINQPLLRHFVWVCSDCHISDIEQPARGEIIGIANEICLVEFDRPARSYGCSPFHLLAHGKNPGARRAAATFVHAQIGDRQHIAQHAIITLVHAQAAAPDLAVDILVGFNGLLRLPALEQLVGDLNPQLQRLPRRHFFAQQRANTRRSRPIQIDIDDGIRRICNIFEIGDHILIIRSAAIGPCRRKLRL